VYLWLVCILTCVWLVCMLTCVGANTGECEDDEVERVLCINAHARPHDRYLVDDKLRNFQLATASHRDLFTDAVITVGGRDFAVHRAVLASASPYFERMFSTQMQEGEGTYCTSTCPDACLTGICGVWDPW